MSLLKKLSVAAIGCGFLVIAVGGMSVRSGPDGTWVQVNGIHAVGGVIFLAGTLLAVVVMSVGNTHAATK
jgi:hypothetical protein